MRHEHYTPCTYPRLGLERLGLSLLCALCALLAVGCGTDTAHITPAERSAVDSLVRGARGLDALRALQQRLEREGDRLGSIVALREWGKELRNESHFDEALSVHSRGLEQVEALGDTLEWVQALNNIGTDYRRMGMLDVAQEYHYRALVLSQAHADSSFAARKNRVVSLNGLGNIYMTLGNYRQADSLLRQALEGEISLGSEVGQAINYANLGAIFEAQGQTDSAWTYYRHSMALNQEAGSTLGIALCHTYYGSLHEKAKQYQDAEREYELAYQLMQASKDEWHALNMLLALAGIYQATDRADKALAYLGQAREVAERIKSKEHLADIYTLYYRHYKHVGDSRAALEAHEQATELRNSVVDMEQVNRIHNTSVNIERKHQAQRTEQAQLQLAQERKVYYTGYAILALVLLYLGALLYIYHLRARSHRALKQMSAMRENFFTNITHEFRTPLTLVIGLGHDIQGRADASPDIVAKAAMIEKQGHGLLALINQLLDISKIKSATGNPDWCNGNIVAHIAMIVESYRDYAHSRSIDLRLHAPQPVVMDFVPDYINKVLNNLLSNAFKFTPEHGYIRIATQRQGDRLLIDIEDSGTGISPESLPHVFEPFYQAEGHGQHLGTGVGLALVKQIMDALEGQIVVESTVGRGTTFRIVLPIHCDSKLACHATPSNSPMLPELPAQLVDSTPEDSERRILIIEDNSDIAAYIGSQIGSHYALSYASDGTQGLEKVLELVPDLIITDLMMPGLSGLDLCREVRSSEIVNHIPIIVVTAKATEAERIEGFKAGADAYLAKPFSTGELCTRVDQLLERHRLLRQKFAHLEAQEASPEEEPQLSDVERQFLTKVIDTAYLLLEKQMLDVNTLAKKLCMSPRQLYRKVVTLTGDTPTSYLMKIKMHKATHLLSSQPDLLIEEVAERSGFEHVSSFYHAFKKVYGITPAEYRRRPSKPEGEAPL